MWLTGSETVGHVLSPTALGNAIGRVRPSVRLFSLHS